MPKETEQTEITSIPNEEIVEQEFELGQEGSGQEIDPDAPEGPLNEDEPQVEGDSHPIDYKAENEALRREAQALQRDVQVMRDFLNGIRTKDPLALSTLAQMTGMDIGGVQKQPVNPLSQVKEAFSKIGLDEIGDTLVQSVESYIRDSLNPIYTQTASNRAETEYSNLITKHPEAAKYSGDIIEKARKHNMSMEDSYKYFFQPYIPKGQDVAKKKAKSMLRQQTTRSTSESTPQFKSFQEAFAYFKKKAEQ